MHSLQLSKLRVLCRVTPLTPPFTFPIGVSGATHARTIAPWNYIPRVPLPRPPRVQAVTSVLAPNLSGQADRAMEAMMMATGSPFPGSGGGNSPQDDVGLSAGAFVHSPRGGLSSGTKDGLRDGTNGNGGGGGEDDRSGAAWHESPSSRLRDRDGQEWWAAARPRLFDFVAKYLELSLVSVGPRLTNAVLVGVAKEVGGGGAAAAASGQAR